MNHHELTMMFLGLALLLGFARILGEVARLIRQPAVLGEILAGVILGSTIFGNAFPELFVEVFPREGPGAAALQGISTLGVALFLLVAGIEVDLSTIFRLRKSATIIGLCGLVTPFAMGFGLGWTLPLSVGMEPGADKLVFSLFLGIALAVSALPVIAKTLIDLRLYRTDLGMAIIAVAIFHDIVGWMIFAVVLALMKSGGESQAGSILSTIVLTLVFASLMLTLGRNLIHRALPWIQAHLSWPGGILGIAVTLALFGAALTEWIGIHAIFGAFIVGVAFGDSSHLRQRTRSVIEQFIGSIFAPIFFASIGLRVDFFANFDLILVVVVLAVACIGETLGCAIGAMWAGFPRRQSWAIGFALNARGAMEIVLATLALQYGVIGERLFVALVIMALVTSIVAGPLMQRVLKRRVGAKVRDYLRPQTFVSDLRATLPKEAIEELSELAAKSDSFAADELAAAAWERERAMSTAFPGGIAIPHAQIQGLQVPIIAVGISNRGLEFDSPDGAPTRLVILVFAGPEHSQQHLELLADIARIFRTGEAVSAACEAKSFTEFLATMNILVSEHGAH